MAELIKRLDRFLGQFPKSGFFEEIYNLARQELWLEICLDIDRYDPKKGSVVTWVMLKLKYKKIQAYNYLTAKGRLLSLDIGQYESRQLQQNTAWSCDMSITLSQQVIKILKQDPEGLFETKLFKKNPQANFKAIALKRLDDISWADIVKELNLGNTTGPISTFYQRCCREFAPKFQQYLGELAI